MVHDNHAHRAFYRIQLQAELVLHGRINGGQRIGGGGQPRPSLSGRPDGTRIRG